MEGWIMPDIRTSQFGGIPFGNNAGRPASPAVGQPYFNGEQQRLELYASAGWQNIVSETPGVLSISGNYLESVGSATISITGTNFTTGAIASATGTNGVEVNANSTTVNSIVSATAVFSGLSAAYEPYSIKVTNTSNLFGLLPNALYINQSPIWQTPSGSLGSFNEQVSITLSALSATDPESTTIQYLLASESSLPSGVTLNASTGVISGTLPDITTDTTYTFSINASDGLNSIPRTFSITSAYTIPVEVLVVAGGGGGGGRAGGGGGAGGLIYSASLSTLKNSTRLITVGTGGAGGGGGIGPGTREESKGTNGTNSVFGSYTAIGGGGGADGNTSSGNNGGSGGGSGYGGARGVATSGQGFDGGLSQMTGTYAYKQGGGGGAGGIGGDGLASGKIGDGGIGLQYSITGTPQFYAAGGGGGGHEPINSSLANNGQGIGGSGVGGNGGFPSGSDAAGTQGADGTGSGGGGTWSNGGNSFDAARGGHGVVIVAYPNIYPALTIPGTLTYDQPTRSGYRVYRFTAGTGTVTF
jgi:hypothetical protein